MQWLVKDAQCALRVACALYCAFLFMNYTDGARHVHHWLQSIILSKADLQLRSFSSLKVSYVECLFRPATALLLSAVSVMDFL